MGIICIKKLLDGSKKPVVGIQHVVPVQLQAQLAQPVKADQQSVHIQSVFIPEAFSHLSWILNFKLNYFMQFLKYTAEIDTGYCHIKPKMVEISTLKFYSIYKINKE